MNTQPSQNSKPAQIDLGADAFRFRYLIFFWIALITIVVLLFVLFRPILSPFVFGLLLAYFLDPLVRKLHKHGVPHGLAALMVALVFFSIGVVFVILVFPILIAQFQNMIAQFPAISARVKDVLANDLSQEVLAFGIDPQALISGIDIAQSDVVAVLGSVANRIFTSSSDMIALLTFLILTPIVSVYILSDWSKLTKAVDDLLPRRSREPLRRLAREVDGSVSALLRGLGVVALIMATFYTIGFFVVGFDYALLMGVLTGIMVFVPYLGGISSLLIGVTLAWLQSDGIGLTAAVAAVYCIGFGIEGYIITPRVVGQRVGLHPVWIIFALLAGGLLAGIVGFIVAMPTAAALAASIRFAVDYYKTTVIYKE